MADDDFGNAHPGSFSSGYEEYLRGFSGFDSYISIASLVTKCSHFQIFNEQFLDCARNIFSNGWAKEFIQQLISNFVKPRKCVCCCRVGFRSSDFNFFITNISCEDEIQFSEHDFNSDLSSPRLSSNDSSRRIRSDKGDRTPDLCVTRSRLKADYCPIAICEIKSRGTRKEKYEATCQAFSFALGLRDSKQIDHDITMLIITPSEWFIGIFSADSTEVVFDMWGVCFESAEEKYFIPKRFLTFVQKLEGLLESKLTCLC